MNVKRKKSVEKGLVRTLKGVTCASVQVATQTTETKELCVQVQSHIKKVFNSLRNNSFFFFYTFLA